MDFEQPSSSGYLLRRPNDGEVIGRLTTVRSEWPWDGPKTSRKARPHDKSKRLKKSDKLRQPAPESKRTSARNMTQPEQDPDPELFIYERAIELFNTGQFQAAKEKFAELTTARNRDLAHSAEWRIRICEQRLAPARSAEIPEFS